MALIETFLGGLAKNIITKANSAMFDAAKLEQQYGYDKALKEQQYNYDTQLAQQKYGYDQSLKEQQYGYDTQLAQQKYSYDTQLAEQQYGHNTQLAQQKYGYDTALSAQAAQQELAKQINQQQFDKMMSDTEMQRKIADYQAAGVNPALAMGGISNTNATSSAQQASAPPAQETTMNAKQAKQKQNTEIVQALTTAIQGAIIKEASKKLASEAKLLANNPKNKNLQNKIKKDFFNYYNLTKL